ncbi:MAG TPA: acylphosphatase [Gemmatimonadaceae bacterium]|nr:acylphosphatase [Gemmatimonadaceae bacterium]
MADLHVRVTGIVQGVGFRWFARERARRLGLDGWVRNLADGSVEVLATGESGQLQLLRDELQRGPDGAVVDQLVELPQAGDPPVVHPFDIIRR